MSKVIRSDPKLWEQVKKEIQGDKIWSARIAQQSVQEYKRRGGKYLSGDKTKTSLHKWTKEDWDYIGKSKRYLPKKVIESLTPNQIKVATKGKTIGERKKYPSIINQKMRLFGIY